MIPAQVHRRYERIAGLADEAYQRVAERHPSRVRCTRGCVDCCHALFGLFPVEAAYLRLHFDGLERKVRRAAAIRARRTARVLSRIQERWEKEGAAGDMAGERVACPLLDEGGRCVLYAHRPITCRVYGIPLRIEGRARVCWKSGFRQGGAYQAFDMDAVQQELYHLSKVMLAHTKPPVDPRSAGLLVSVASVLLSGPEPFKA